MPRPRLTPNRKRSERLVVRLSPDELAELAEACAESEARTQAQWVRDAVLERARQASPPKRSK